MHLAAANKAYALRELDALVQGGAVTVEKPVAVSARLEGHLVDDDRPQVWPMLAPILIAWDSLGAPFSRVDGMAAALLDNRAPLYLARRAWLDEQGFVSYDSRQAVLDLFEAMDREEADCIAEQMRSKGRA